MRFCRFAYCMVFWLLGLATLGHGAGVTALDIRDCASKPQCWIADAREHRKDQSSIAALYRSMRTYNYQKHKHTLRCTAPQGRPLLQEQAGTPPLNFYKIHKDLDLQIWDIQRSQACQPTPS